MKAKVRIYWVVSGTIEIEGKDENDIIAKSEDIKCSINKKSLKDVKVDFEGSELV
jgi:hypothetical protein